MTATYPAQTDKAYRGVVYGIDLLDHASVMADAPQIVPDDYVGKTRQRGRGRENQHRDDKPWADLIVGSSHRLWEGICDEDELDSRERTMIREKRPRMNNKDNRWNRERIEYEDQLVQRHERDRKFGRPLWQPPELRRRESLLEWQTPDGPTYDRDSSVRQKPSVLSRWRRYLMALVGQAIKATARRIASLAKILIPRMGVWAGSTLVAWLLELHWHVGGWKQTLLMAALVLPMTLLVVWLIMLEKAGKRTRKRFLRRLFGWPR